MSINLWFDYYNNNAMAHWANFVNGLGTNINYGVDVDLYNTTFLVGTSGAGFSNIHNIDYSVVGTVRPFSGYAIRYGIDGNQLIKNYISNISNPSVNTVTSNCIVVNRNSAEFYVGGSSVGFADIYNSNDATSGLFIPRTSGFLVKYDVDGNVLWRSFVSNTQTTVTGCSINGLALTNDGNFIYAVGNTGIATAGTLVSNIFDASASFPNTTQYGFRNITTTDSKAFIIKYNSDGLFQWRAFIDSVSVDHSMACAVDAYSNVYMVGYNAGSSPTTIYNSPQTETSSGQTITETNCAYLLKYNSDGFLQWRALINSTGSDYGYGVVVDSENSVYISGISGAGAAASINNSNIYGTSSTTGVTIPVNSGFIVKYNQSGLFSWRAYVNTGVIRGICVDTQDNIVVCGTSTGNPATIVTSSTINSLQIPQNVPFIIKFDKYGNVLNRNYLTSGNAFDVITNPSDNIISVGGAGTVNAFVLNSNASSNSTSNYSIINSSGYIVKYNSNGEISTLGVNPASVSNGWVSYWSNLTCTVLGSTTVPDYTYCVGSTSSSSTVSLLYNFDRTFTGLTIAPNAGYVLKYNNDGYLLWRSYLFGTSSSFRSITGVSSDVTYVAGNIGTSNNPVLIDSKGFISRNPTTITANSGIIIRYNADGTIFSSTIISNVSSLNSIYYESVEQCVYVTGLSHPTLTSNIIQPDDSVALNDGASPIAIPPNVSFVVKMNSSLYNVWGGVNGCVQIRPNIVTSANLHINYSINGLYPYIYVAGSSIGTSPTNFVQPDNTILSSVISRSNVAYLIGFDTLGSYFTDSYVDSLTTGTNEVGSAVLCTGSGIYFTGFTAGAIANAYNSTNTIYGGFVSIPANSTFLLKYDYNNNLLWSSNIDATTTSNCLAVDSNGDVYLGGNTTATTAAISHSNIYGGISSGLPIPAIGGYIIKYNGNTGAVKWKSTIQGTSNAPIRGLSTDASNYVYASGFTGGTTATVFNTSNFTTSQTILPNSGFITKFKPNGNLIF